MSTFVLKREYALQMPTSYVDIERAEMEYVEGGGSLPTWAISAPINFALSLNPGVSLAFGGITALIKYGVKSAAKKATKSFLRGALTALSWVIGGLYSGLGIAIRSITNSSLDEAVTVIFSSFNGIGGVLAIGADAIDGRVDGMVRW